MAREGRRRRGPVPHSPERTGHRVFDALTTAVKKLIALGKGRGYVAYDEVDALSAAHGAAPEMIEDLMAMLNDVGIHVVSEAEDGDGRGAAPAAEP